MTDLTLPRLGCPQHLSGANIGGTFIASVGKPSPRSLKTHFPISLLILKLMGCICVHLSHVSYIYQLVPYWERKKKKKYFLNSPPLPNPPVGHILRIFSLFKALWS